MSTKHEPAFPIPEARNIHQQLTPASNTGMTLRDYFAAAALPAIISKASITTSQMKKEYAEAAYDWADAMMRARNNG